MSAIATTHEGSAPSAAASAEENPLNVIRPRPAAIDGLLRRCAALAARARVDAISDLDAPSLRELSAVIDEIGTARTQGAEQPSAPLPCLAGAALEDLRHELDQRAEEPVARVHLAEVDRALALIRADAPADA